MDLETYCERLATLAVDFGANVQHDQIVAITYAPGMEPLVYAITQYSNGGPLDDQSICRAAVTPLWDFKGEYWTLQDTGRGGPYYHVMTPNQSACAVSSAFGNVDSFIGAGSLHPGGVNVLLLDGSVRFDGLTVDTDLRWTLLCGLARNGRADGARIGEELARDNTISGKEHAAAASVGRLRRGALRPRRRRRPRGKGRVRPRGRFLRP